MHHCILVQKSWIQESKKLEFIKDYVFRIIFCFLRGYYPFFNLFGSDNSVPQSDPISDVIHDDENTKSAAYEMLWDVNLGDFVSLDNGAVAL